jgi:hypothetical protein
VSNCEGDVHACANGDLGDPPLHHLAWLGDLKIYVVPAALSLVSMPSITSQLDGGRFGHCSRTAASGSPFFVAQKAPQSLRGAKLLLCVAGC